MDEEDSEEVTPARMPPASPRGKEPATTAEPPRAYGPRAIGGLIARVTRPAFRRRSPAAAQIMADWLEIIGPELGPRTVPQKLSAGTLTIACAGPVAMELQHFAPQLIARLNGHIGGHGDRAPIQRLRFVQQIATPPARRDAGRPPRIPAVKPPPDIGLEEGPLRDALARLAQAIEARRG